MNKSLDKVLMIHHNIRNTWAWTGGHVDGDTDFLHVAIKEAKEETGIKEKIYIKSISEQYIQKTYLDIKHKIGGL